MAEKDRKQLDSNKQAEKKYAMDIDRMINEGLGGGTVDFRNRSGKIEDARALDHEEPANENETDDD